MKTNTQKGFVIPLVIAIVVLLIIGGVYYFSKKTEYITDNTPSDIVQLLKTYTNVKGGYSFNYPKDFTVFERLISDNKGNPVTRVELKSSSNNYEIGVTLLNLNVNTMVRNFNDAKNEAEQYKSTNNYRDVEIGLFSGYRRQEKLNYLEGERIAVSYQLLNKENKSQWLRAEIMSALNSSLPTIAETQVMDILQTFKFINQ